MEKNSSSRSQVFALLVSAFATLACLAPRLAAQDVTVMPPALFDVPNKSDTPPTLTEEWAPRFPDELRTITEPIYVIFTQRLDEKGRRSSWRWRANVSDVTYFGKRTFDLSTLECAPARKNNKPIASWSWFGMIYNPASASEKAPDATPRLLKVAPIVIPLEQWFALPQGRSVVRGSIDIDAAGAAKNLKLEDNSSRARAVRPAIERSLAKWQFAPARKDGQPVPASLQLGFALQIAPTPGKDKPPEVIKQPPPFYPLVMRNSGMIGEVTLSFIVTANGDVENPSVIRSNNPNFEQPAIDAILQWKFKPGIKDGMPMNARMQIPISFNLQDDGDPTFEGKTAYTTPQLSKKQIAQMPEGLRYDVAPEARGVIYPVYPYEMLRDGKKGDARVAVFVSSRGDVGPITVVNETAPEFGNAALAACEYFEFNPGLLEGKPTDAVVTIKQEFNSDSLFVTGEDRAMLRLEKKSPQKIIGSAKLDAAPKRIVTREPPFPITALQDDITAGDAVVEFLIDTEGKVRLPRIVSATHPSFGYVAAQTVANWRYEPPKAQGKPVVTRARVPFHFSAKDTAPSGD